MAQMCRQTVKNTITIIGVVLIVRLWQLEKTCIIWMETKSWRRMLVYNTMDKIYSYDPETEQEQVLYTLTDEEKQIGDIYGSVVNGNLLQYVLLQRPSRPETIYSIQISPYITVTEGGYAYYLKDGTILNQQELDIPVPGAAKTVKIFAAAKGSYAPLCKAIELRAAG